MAEQVVQEVAQLITQVQKDIERLFRDLWSRLSSEGVVPAAWEPPVDVIDRGEEIVVLIDVPGFSKDDVKVKVAENSLEIFAQRSTVVPIEGKYLIRQRIRESLYKRIELPVKIRPEQAKAKLENGVLEIRAPKSEVAKEIQVVIE